MVQRTSELVLGPLQRVLERLDAASAVEMVGKLELDRIRVYAALLGEEGAIHEAGGRAARAQDCFRRALELYAAISLAGAKLKTADWERIVLLHSKVASDQVEIRYRDELRRLAGRRAPSD